MIYIYGLTSELATAYSATLSIAQSAQTVASAGTVRVSGGLSALQGAHSLFDGSATVGTPSGLTKQQDNETLSAARIGYCRRDALSHSGCQYSVRRRQFVGVGDAFRHAGR
jgi:hypothetical protein